MRLTADGILVCVHDRKVNRTSNGRGVVSTLELADLAELDFGSWRETWEDFEDPAVIDDARRSVLTLEMLLDLVADSGRPIELAIETKHPTRYAGLVEERLVALLDRYGWAHPRLGRGTPVRVMSFSMLSMRRMRRLAPSVPTVLLMERVPVRMRDGSLPPGVRIAGPAIEIVRAYPRYVEQRARARPPGARVDRRRARRCAPVRGSRRRRGHHQPPGRGAPPAGRPRGAGRRLNGLPAIGSEIARGEWVWAPARPG